MDTIGLVGECKNGRKIVNGVCGSTNNGNYIVTI